MKCDKAIINALVYALGVHDVDPTYRCYANFVRFGDLGGKWRIDYYTHGTIRFIANNFDLSVHCDHCSIPCCVALAAPHLRGEFTP